MKQQPSAWYSIVPFQNMVWQLHWKMLFCVNTPWEEKQKCLLWHQSNFLLQHFRVFLIHFLNFDLIICFSFSSYFSRSLAIYLIIYNLSGILITDWSISNICVEHICNKSFLERYLRCCRFYFNFSIFFLKL